MIKRVVLDTAVAVAALRTRAGAGSAVLRLAANRRLVPLATPPLFLGIGGCAEASGAAHRPRLNPGDG